MQFAKLFFARTCDEKPHYHALHAEALVRFYTVSKQADNSGLQEDRNAERVACDAFCGAQNALSTEAKRLANL